MEVNLQSGFQLEERDLPSYIDWLETQEPNNPEVLAYRQKEKQVVVVDRPAAHGEQSEDALVREMLGLAESEEAESEDDPMKRNDQLIQDFCDGKGIFANVG